MNHEDTKTRSLKAATPLDPNLESVVTRVIDAAFEVHRVLGPGYLESVYEEAFAIELCERNLSFERQPMISVAYKGRPVGQSRLDFLVAGRIVIELKAVEALLPIHTAQVLSYLRVTGLPLGLLLNFNANLIKNGIRRIVHARALAVDVPRVREKAS